MVKEKRGRKTNKKNEKGKKGCKKSKYFPKRDIARFAHDTRYEQYRSELGDQTTPHSDLYCKESLYYFAILQPR